MKEQLRHIAQSFREVIHAAVISAMVVGSIAAASASDVAGQVLVKPKLSKYPVIIKMPDLGIMDLNEGLEPNTVFVFVGNIGSGNAGPFYIRVSLKAKDWTTKKYFEKRISGLSAKTDLPVYINVGQPTTGLEIGIYLDSKKQVAETNEKENCGKIYPGGAATGLASCENF